MISNPETMYPTMYTPATNNPQKLLRYMEGGVEQVRRFVVCTEDAISEDRLPAALQNLQETLAAYEPTEKTAVFVRVRNQEVTEMVLAMDGVAKITGFVIPKADPVSYPEYASMISKSKEDFHIMPILESPAMTDYMYRRDLLDVLGEPCHRQNIDCLRIGANDLMSSLDMRRPKKVLTIYDTVIGKLINDIIIEYRGNGGFEIAAPVFEYFGSQYAALFQKEISQHVANQLYGQVVIHPNQLSPLWDAYKVTAEEVSDAESIKLLGSEAVIGKGNRLLNAATHTNWAGRILTRAALFGITD